MARYPCQPSERKLLTAEDIINACLTSGTEADWKLFIGHFQTIIAANVARVARRYGIADPALVDDLSQETYLRLLRDDFRCLREFRARHDDAIFGFIKVIATSVALDHFRFRNAQKRKGEVASDATDIEVSVSSASIEKEALLGELDQRLHATESERDRAIFWLYYRQGYTTKDIAAIPRLGLTQKGVESCIYRLTQSLRTSVMSNLRRIPYLPKGKVDQATLGEVQ
jgi:RNA polymerase sigma-70 factor (ECF subfamily)